MTYWGSFGREFKGGDVLGYSGLGSTDMDERQAQYNTHAPTENLIK